MSSRHVCLGGAEESCSNDKSSLLYRSDAEVVSGAACQAEDLSNQLGVSDASCSSSIAREDRRLKQASEWQLQHCRSTCGHTDAIAATVCAWQTPSEAAALLETIVMQPML